MPDIEQIIEEIIVSLTESIYDRQNRILIKLGCEFLLTDDPEPTETVQVGSFEATGYWI